jgi:sec-independent protein translocase protein TatA
MAGFASPWHIAIFALVVLLVFGTKRLPEIGRSVGTGMKEFKRSISHDEEPTPNALTTAPAAPVATSESAGSRRDHDSIG